MNKIDDLRAYCRAISQVLATGQATEHSYRPALQTLVQRLGGDGVVAVNEPSHVACGAPDFIVQRQGVPIGHIECKDLPANLHAVETTEQLARYRAGLPNLILTDYMEFRWYAHGDLRETARLGRIIRDSGVATSTADARRVGTLFEMFLAADPPTVEDSRELAKRMATKTRLLRDGIKLILQTESASGPLRDILTAYRKVLITDLTDDAFADLQAQTAAYGLFAARWQHHTADGPFTRQTAAFTPTTPFLRDVFGRIAGPGIDPRIAWIVDDLALLLDRTSLPAILEDFGNRKSEEDPVVHFYEDFLASYDPKLREVRGVYYTPEPVVSYIVKSLDHILRQSFGFEDGLAETAAAPGGAHKAVILDPAVGSGTFLREVVSQIRETIEKKGLSGAWPNYVKAHLLPRLFGFELLMAPYAICHLKLAVELAGGDPGSLMPDGHRLGVFLTNTLEEPHEQTAGALFAHEIAREAASAQTVKQEKPVMVVLGNPPYSGHSANKGKWITDLIDDYKKGVPELSKPAQAKWLSDDYVKFIRFAQWRIERTGEGVLGFVTNHAYLDNPTFRGMRRSLTETFDEIYVLDLHGNAKKGNRGPGGVKDENVFDIQQGVAIGLFIKRQAGEGLARVFHADIWGGRQTSNGGKYGWLSTNDVASTSWTELSPRPPTHLFVPRDDALAAEYEAGWSIRDIFSPSGDPAPGIVTTHDQFAISWTREEAATKVKRLLDTASETEARSHWRLCSQQQWQYHRAKSELSDGSWKRRIVPVLYRPFDTRVTVFDRNVAVHRRERVMRHMLAGPNIGLISCRQRSQIDGPWSLCGVTRGIIESCAISNRTKEINYLFPLYRYPTETPVDLGASRIANVDPRFIDAISANLGLNLVPDGNGDLSETLGPEDAFHYIYAVLHSAEYRRRYADFLKADFPCIPLTRDLALFVSLANIGERLVGIHLMEEKPGEMPTFPCQGTDRVESLRYVAPASGNAGRVWINGDQYFEGVGPKTWGFAFGGYKPVAKWLKDRKGRVLSYEDIDHYRTLCAGLSQTQQLMLSIEGAIEDRGGWPIA